jgi:hypothetical protein
MPGRLLPVTARARPTEKVPAVAGFGHRLRLLPWWDGRGDEPADFRRSVRKMVHESNVKGALLDKVFSVASLDLQVHPASDDARDGLIADGFRANFESMDGGLRGFFGEVILNGLIDAHSVCEKVWRVQERGKWRGQWGYAAVKFKDGAELVADEFNNVRGVRSVTGGEPQVWDAADFVVFIHLPLFGKLAGTSDLRAAYKAWWLIENVDEMRALAAEKFSTPFLQGEYPPGEDDVRRALESAMEAAAGQTWVSIPMGTRLTMLDLATRGQADYQAFKDDQRRDVYLGICGAVLQAVEGTTTGGRGNSQVHRGTADTRAWYVASVAAELIGRQMVPDYVDANYLGNPEYPTVTIGSVNDAEMTASLAVDSGLQDMGYDLSKKELGKRYGRQWASSPDDVLRKPSVAPAPGGGPVSPFLGG